MHAQESRRPERGISELCARAILAIEAVAGAEALDLPHDGLLLSVQPRELAAPLRECASVLGSEVTDQVATFDGTQLRGAMDVVRNREQVAGQNSLLRLTSNYPNWSSSRRQP